ncbi:hypothetical protein BU23DRAFT_475283 [Bimuria novae-zelandiae CBS 107.79]|uniref:Uncharacterized protein n=1 Tax=Bimuria novae-zelandiae CBS 107.79 TaxID=1447943 RepID=A0A6A5UYJ0_9PLEO|nr:hypothetical protein BU23DRAFT_475283 [Bimuria novae-zelandiae CBS 107.79]
MLIGYTHGQNRGFIHQLGDGQNRLNDPTLPNGNFTYTRGPNGNGIVDDHGRGCIITPGLTKQFQCDEGVKPELGFEVGCNGTLMYRGSVDFWACAVNDQGVTNVYVEPVLHQKKCTYVNLMATPANTTSTANVPKPSPSQPHGNKSPAYGCPHDLKGDFEWPRIIHPLDRAHPNKVVPELKNGLVLDDEFCQLYTFQVNPSWRAKRCSLIWLFPDEEDIEHPSYLFSTESNSSALLEFWHVDKPSLLNSTWNSVGPSKIVSVGPVGPGFSYNAKTWQCSASELQRFVVCGRHFALLYYQQLIPNPIGLFLRAC